MAFDSGTTNYYYKPSLETCPEEEEEDEGSHGSDQECDANVLLVDLLPQQQQHYQWSKVLMSGFCDPFKKMKRHPRPSCSSSRKQLQKQHQLLPQSTLSPPAAKLLPLVVAMPMTETTTSSSCDSDSISESSENEITTMVMMDSPKKEDDEHAEQDTSNEKETPRAEDTSKRSHTTTSSTSVTEKIESTNHRIEEATEWILRKNLDASFHPPEEEKVLHLTMNSLQFCLAIAFFVVICFHYSKFTYYQSHQPKNVAATADILVLSAEVERVQDALLLQEVIVFSKEQHVSPTRLTRELFHVVQLEENENKEEQKFSSPHKEEDSTIQQLSAPLDLVSSETKNDVQENFYYFMDNKNKNSMEHADSYPLKSPPMGDLKEEQPSMNVLLTTTSSKGDEAASTTPFTRHLLFVSKRRSYVPVQIPSLKNKKGWQPLNYVNNRISNVPSRRGDKNWISTRFAVKWSLVPLTTKVIFQNIIHGVQNVLRISKNWLLRQVKGVLKQRVVSYSK